MEIGMLWFDNDPKSDFASKVKKAVSFYTNKYGEEPNRCCVHPSMIPGAEIRIGEITVCANSSVLLNHFWIGVDQPEPVKV